MKKENQLPTSKITDDLFEDAHLSIDIGLGRPSIRQRLKNLISPQLQLNDQDKEWLEEFGGLM